MPPSKRAQEDPQSLKEKLHSLQGTGARGRRNGHTNAANGSNLKEVMSSNGDNASTNSGQNEHTSGGTRWDTQDTAVLQNYRRAYRIDTQPPFKNPLSHVVLNQGIGRFSPTMARPKSKTRVEKSQVALAVRKNFNAQAVSETNCIVDWIYTVKNQDKEFRVRFAPPRK